MFADEVPVLNIFTDYPRPAVQSFDGDSVGFELTAAETRALKSIVVNGSITLYMILLSIYNVLLAKLTNREDIVIGTPTAGRRHADLENTIGMFVNTLALRNYPEGHKEFAAFLTEVKERTLEAFENQEYPFEDLVENVVLTKDVSRNPLFDTMLALQNTGYQKNETPGLKWVPYRLENKTAKFDLSLTAVEVEEKLLLTFAYSTKLFKPETIARFIVYFKNIVSRIIENKNQKISALEILTEEEKNRLLYDFNNTAVDYPKNKTIHQLFAEQVEKAPDHISLAQICRPIAMSYNELNERSNQLAGLLIEKGARADQIIGIKMERSIEMITGLLGILKSGGAYLPIDPEYPQERIEYMLKDSNAKIMLGNRQACSEIHHSSFVVHHSSQLAYLIYTSGSTGRPKGVMIEHRNVARLVKNSNYIHFTSQDRLLPTGSPAFDITTFEIWGPLCNGAMLSLVSKDMILNAGKLKEVLVNHHITILHLIPQLFNQLAAGDSELFARLRCFLVGGDLVSSAYINALRKRYSHLKILHMYGPTENTTFSTYFPVEQDYELNIPIGTPVANSTAYVIDKYEHLQPISVMGELCVGGEGIARGYLNNPELTSEKFKHDLWDYRDNHDEKNKRLAGSIYKTGDVARWLADGNI
ncbi:MAG TPA: amino acid adenylation domain-containing protein, partial [Candidatus Deferrimicrobium sp.]|nr:amino acid adenylation domain-containing protein [Candidatus Deferrimicrobium sp.]